MRRMREEREARAVLEQCERALATWQLASDAHAQSVALGQRETQVERARIEQLENQQRRLLQQQERQESERCGARATATGGGPGDAGGAGGARARGRTEGRRRTGRVAGRVDRSPASASANETQALNALRARWQQALGSQVSTEALQQAALGKVSGKVTQWLQGARARSSSRASRSSCAWSAAGSGRSRPFSVRISRRCASTAWTRSPICWRASTAAIWRW